MKRTEILMGMPITVEIADSFATDGDVQRIFSFFADIEQRFSPYLESSEVRMIGRGEVLPEEYSGDMREVMALAEKTKEETRGFFDVWHNGHFDPSGIVKGWAIFKAAELLLASGFHNFFVDAGGDIEARGHNEDGKSWQIGIRNPFDPYSIIKTIQLSDMGVATSGSYVRGSHIYNPHVPDDPLQEIVSITVIGPNVLEADRFATAAFAMGGEGAKFIATRPELAAYAVGITGIATMTDSFQKFVVQ